jgi:hypothetical protein
MAGVYMAILLTICVALFAAIFYWLYKETSLEEKNEYIFDYIKTLLIDGQIENNSGYNFNNVTALLKMEIEEEIRFFVIFDNNYTTLYNLTAVFDTVSITNTRLKFFHPDTKNVPELIHYINKKTSVRVLCYTEIQSGASTIQVPK